MKKPEVMSPIKNWASLEACKKYADKEFIFISKSDLIPEKELKKKLKLLKGASSLSIVDEESMNNVKKILNTIIAEKKEV